MAFYVFHNWVFNNFLRDQITYNLEISTMERVKDFFESLKPRFKIMGLCFLFLTVTTFVSVSMIYVPTLISPDIFMADFNLTSAILGSFFGQITILTAITIIGRLKK